MNARPAAALAALLPLLPAQGPTFVPKGLELVSFHADRVDELVAAWPATALGRMLADPDVAPAARACVDYVSRALRRQQALRAAGLATDLDLEPYVLAGTVRQSEAEVLRLLYRPVAELRAASVRMLHPVADGAAGRMPREAMVLTLQCGPRHQGRWAQAFEQEVAALRKSRFFEHVDDKLDGMPLHALHARPDVLGFDPQLGAYYDRWLLRLPGTFVYGPGDAQRLGRIGVEPPAEHPGVRFRMHLGAFVEMWRAMGRQIPRDFTALGFEQLEWLDWRGRFVGEHLLDEFSVKVDGELQGLTKVVLGGTATPPAQALPKGALAQLRGCLDVPTLLENLALFDGPELPEEVMRRAAAALDGGFALACCAPAPGGLIPRVYVTLGVADEQAFEELLGAVLNKRDNLPLKQVTYDGVACTVLQVPDMPQGVQPAWCVHEGRLHLAESARSLRQLLKAQRSGADRMDVGDAPVPEGAGEVLPNLELTFDPARLYQCYYEQWLPLFELGGGVTRARPPAIRRADLPEPELFAEYVGPSRGLLRKDGDVFRLQVLGPLGGPELAAALLTFGPMLSPELVYDYRTTQLARAIALDRLDRAWDALSAFHRREQRWPKDLAELFAAEKLPKDLLFVPGDDLAETFELADGATGRTSFRYFPEPVRMDAGNADQPMLLVELRQAPYGRSVLDASGQTPEVYGRQALAPVDELAGR